MEKMNLIVCPFCGRTAIKEENKTICLYCGFLNYDYPEKNPIISEIVKEANEYFIASRINYQFKFYVNKRRLLSETIQSFELGFDDGKLNKYLISKGFSKDDIEKTGLCHFKEDDAWDCYYKRIIFPIRDHNNELCGFGARRINDDDWGPKYINSPQNENFNKSGLLYGFNKAINIAPEEIFVVEGFVDVISMHQAGIVNTCGVLGTAITEQHCALIKEHGITDITVMLDSDAAGTSSMCRSLPMLMEHFNVSVLIIPGAKDPDEYLEEYSANDLLACPKISGTEFLRKNGVNVDKYIIRNSM